MLSVYAVAVTLSGFSPNIGDFFGISSHNQVYLLIAFRAIQGNGIAIFPIAFAMIREEFPREKVAGSLGIVSGMFSVGAAAGFVGGTWITQNYN